MKRILSPAGLAARAVLLLALFLVLHLAGARTYTSILCGTGPTADGASGWPVVLGGGYVLAWFGAVLGAPILFLAAGLLALWPARRPPSDVIHS